LGAPARTYLREHRQVHGILEGMTFIFKKTPKNTSFLKDINSPICNLQKLSSPSQVLQCLSQLAIAASNKIYIVKHARSHALEQRTLPNDAMMQITTN
jgi:hypothetical protein